MAWGVNEIEEVAFISAVREYKSKGRGFYTHFPVHLVPPIVSPLHLLLQIPVFTPLRVMSLSDEHVAEQCLSMMQMPSYHNVPDERWLGTQT